MSKLYLGLVHYPVLNKNNEVVQTSVTNLDIHDIARCAFMFGVKKYFIITADKNQQDYVYKVIEFWNTASAETYNTDRSRALSIVDITDSVQASIKQITMQEGMQPIVISTTARQMSKQISTQEMGQLSLNKNPILVLFGTGYGLTDDIHAHADYILQSITGLGEFNHISVRSAVAIILDRINSAVYKGRN